MLTVLLLNHFITRCFEKCQYNCCQSNVVTCFFGPGTSKNKLTPVTNLKCRFLFIFFIAISVSAAQLPGEGTFDLNCFL